MTHQITDVDAILTCIESELKQYCEEKIFRHEKWDAKEFRIAETTSRIYLRSFSYLTPTPLKRPLSINTLEYNNNTDNQVEAKFPIQTRKTSATFSFTLNSSIKLTGKYALQVGVPGLPSTSIEIGMGVDFSSTETQTHTTEQSWTYDLPIPVPARAKVCANLLIDQLNFNSDFVAELVLTGEIKVEGSAKRLSMFSGSETVNFSWTLYQTALIRTHVPTDGGL